MLKACRVQTLTEVSSRTRVSLELLVLLFVSPDFVFNRHPSAVDPYVIITCEGERVRSPVQKDARSPNFDIKGLFYRKKPKEGIHVEVSVHSRLPSLKRRKENRVPHL